VQIKACSTVPSSTKPASAGDKGEKAAGEVASTAGVVPQVQVLASSLSFASASSTSSSTLHWVRPARDMEALPGR